MGEQDVFAFLAEPADHQDEGYERSEELIKQKEQRLGELLVLITSLKVKMFSFNHARLTRGPSEHGESSLQREAHSSSQADS